MAFGKIELPCSDERERSAFMQYVQCEKDIRLFGELDKEQSESFSRTALLLYGHLFSELDLAVYQVEHVPKHGPGATAERLLGNQKYDLSMWTSRLDRYFPIEEFLIPSYRYWEELSGATVLEPGDEMPVRVISVPKTLKTPRIIAIEPTCMQYAQQSLMEMFVEGIEGDDILSPFIGFTDQVPNQELARLGSIDGSLATLDLSEASDRVSTQHVELLLRHFPHLGGAAFACRSTTAEVPGHGVIPLAKFASMGSALCFPIEAMVFLNIIILSIAEQQGVPVSAKLIKSLAGRVRVYGDDIIVPSTYASGVACSLEAFGLKVNFRKSFWNGSFRESCGGDFFSGHRVTPVRVRAEFPSSLKDAHEVSSAVSLRNQLFERGFTKAVSFMDDLLSRVLPVYPEVSKESPVLGRHTHGSLTVDRWHPTLHVPLVKGCVVKGVLPVSVLEGVGALMKFFLRRGDEPLERSSFQRAGRPSSVRITTKWVPAY